MADVDEAAAVGRVLGGDAEAFGVIVERYQRPIYRFVANMLGGSGGGGGSGGEVEDVAQEVFLAAYRNLHRFDPRKGRLSTWLFAMARNRVINLLAKQRPREALSGGSAMATPDPSDGLQRQETLAALDAALAALPVAQRTAFVLAEIEEMSLAEVAEIEGVPVGTIKSRLSRAKEALRGALRHVHGVER